MIAPFRLRAALCALVLSVHGMGLCVAADAEASAAPQASLVAGTPEAAPPPALALLLPLASRDFARPAEALELGFLAAHQQSGGKLTVGIVPTA